MKTVIIPTDFSDTAWKAASYAANLYHKTPCHFVLLTAYDIPQIALESPDPGMMTTKARESHRAMADFLEQFTQFEHHADSKFDIISRFGKASDIISAQVEQTNADVVVMGTNGIGERVGAFLGTTASATIRKAECPVLCIPGGIDLQEPRHIMFSTDYKHVDELSALDEFRAIARDHQSKVSIVNIRATQKAAVSVEEGMEGLVLHDYLDDVDHEYFDRAGDAPEQAILDFAHQREVDLIVMLKRDRNFFERLIHSSVSRQVALHTDLPLLILKE